jgi:hypothetical protein
MGTVWKLPATELEEVLAATTLTWADPADNAANTVKTQDITAPDNVVQKYLLVVGVTSAAATYESDFTIQIFNTETLLVAGTPRTTAQAKLTSVIVPKIQTIKGTAVSAYSFPIEGLFAGGMDVRLVCSNDSAMTVVNSLDIRLRELWK